jgi:hypothetical protein
VVADAPESAGAFALPFKGRVGWGWVCPSSLSFFFVHHFLCSSFRRLRAPERANSEACPKGERQDGANQAGIQLSSFHLQSFVSPLASRLLFGIAPKSNQKGLAPDAVF